MYIYVDVYIHLHIYIHIHTYIYVLVFHVAFQVTKTLQQFHIS